MADLSHEEKLVLIQYAIKKYEKEDELISKLKTIQLVYDKFFKLVFN